MTRGKGDVISYERLLLARARHGNKAAAEGLARIAAAGSQAAAHLKSAVEGLRDVQRACLEAGERFAESARFREQCEAAAQLGSVEEMIRRRDELLAEHRRRRK
jgi:hypothetical protein